ncbi:MAG: VacJ family lipoprotein [Deltaproteobacteria bacterium]|nr:VacJ family lipoprotein [Deltaproteobacteria bacterium]
MTFLGNRTLTPALAMTGILALFAGCSTKTAKPLYLATGPEKAASYAAEPPAYPLARAEENPALEKDPFADESLDFLEEEEPATRMPDPLEPFNRLMFKVNDKFYFWLLKPAARGYKAVTPSRVRKSVRNFFGNLLAPVRVANCALQGKPDQAIHQFSRFMYNSTIGVAGLFDPASSHPLLQPQNEDLGQTLGAWGLGHGIYLVLPVLGPSSLRDGAGIFGDGYLNPANYVDPLWAAISLRAWNTVNDTTFRLGDYQDLKEAAIDPYVALKNAYLQRRATMVKD